MHIHNHEELALAVINGLNTNNCHRLIGDGFGPNEAMEIGYNINELRNQYTKAPFESWEDVYSYLIECGFDNEDCDNIYHWALSVVSERHREMLDKKQVRATARMMNRARYLAEPVLQYRRFSRKLEDIETGEVTYQQAEAWRYDVMLRSMGLMNLIIEHAGGNNGQPVAVQLVNMLPKEKDPDTGEEKARPPVPPEEWANANDHRIAVSGERLGWNMNSLGWKMLCNAFPNAVALSAYGHSLNSPVLPAGYWAGVPITLRKLTDHEGNDIGTDGSGLWNVDHPIFEEFILRHGICGWQIRGMHPRHGVFVKGAVRPVNLGADGPAFVLDWNQVKGVKKKNAMKLREENKEFIQHGMHIGCMQVWNKPNATLKSCFEMLENIEVNKETVSIVKEMVDEALDKLKRRGTDRMIAAVCQDDERLAQIVQLINMMKQRGADLEATQIPMIQSAVKSKLEKIMWHIVQGAGISYKQRLCILDNTVKPGTIVAPGIKPGTTVTSFRFPMVLAQGLRTLTVVPPSPHMKCNGKPVQCMVFMNPQDLTVCMQGDDDGDIVGISTDPRMAKLFQHLVDRNVYHIEPEGKKIWYDTNSPEGLEYLRWDQRGPVGLATVYRSSLLAVGDIDGARAMSLIIQECVDAAKRKPDWSDFRAAAKLENWTKDENGEYHFNIRLPENELEDGGLPLEMMRDWVHDRLIARGCVKTIYQEGEAKQVPDNATAWRWPGKRVDLDKWVPTNHRTSYREGNLVHICHDYAFEQFAPIRPMFKLDNPPINIAVLLPMMLASMGVATTMVCEDWTTYERTLRHKAWLHQFGQKMRQIHEKKNNNDRDQHHRSIDGAIAELNHNLEKANLSLNEIVTIWVMESSRTDDNGMPLAAGLNNAFRVLSIPDNDVILALGITKKASCDWMLKQIKVNIGGKQHLMRRIDYAVAVSLKKSNPQEHLAGAIFKDTQHYRERTDEDGKGIHLWECPHCQKLVTDALIRKIRSDRESSESQWLRSTISAMNG